MKVLVAGVDGGGTHTRVLIADESGAQLGSAEGIGSAVKPGRVEASADVIAALVDDALQGVESDGARVRVACLGLSGVGRDEEREALQRALADRFADETIVVTDAEVAIEDAFGDSPGVLLIAGTGSICYGRGPAGAAARCGGWGLAIGDEGSGSWLGRRALSVVAAAADGRESETALSAAVLSTLGLTSAEAMIPWATAASPADLARLAPVVLETAKAGDLRANALVTLGVEELALHIRTLARRLFVDERAALPVALSGGLIQKGSLLRKRLEARLRSMVPGAVVQSADVIPARGAVKRALRALVLARASGD